MTSIVGIGVDVLGGEVGAEADFGSGMAMRMKRKVRLTIRERGRWRIPVIRLYGTPILLNVLSRGGATKRVLSRLRCEADFVLASA